MSLGCAILLNKSTNTRKLVFVTPGLKTHKKFERIHYNSNEKIHTLFQTNIDHPSVRKLNQLKEEGIFSEILHFSQCYSDEYLDQLKQFRIFDDKNKYGEGLYTCCEPLIHDECQKFLAEDLVNHTIEGAVTFHVNLNFRVNGCSVFILPRPENEHMISEEENFFVYREEKSKDPAGGTITFNGTATDKWYIQIGTTLTTGANSSVNLTNGALPGNIYWQIGSSGTFGANTAFKGQVVAFTSLTVGAGTNNNGRLWVVNAAITLDNNTISP